MAPEQLAGRDVSTKSDLYSLGLILYEILTGKRAFEAATLPELMKQRESGAVTNPSRSEEHTSELQSLTNLVCRLLLEKKRKPRQRICWLAGRAEECMTLSWGARPGVTESQFARSTGVAPARVAGVAASVRRTPVHQV